MLGYLLLRFADFLEAANDKLHRFLDRHRPDGVMSLNEIEDTLKWDAWRGRLN